MNRPLLPKKSKETIPSISFLRWEDPETWQTWHANQIFGYITGPQGILSLSSRDDLTILISLDLVLQFASISSLFSMMNVEKGTTRIKIYTSATFDDVEPLGQGICY